MRRGHTVPSMRLLVLSLAMPLLACEPFPYLELEDTEAAAAAPYPRLLPIPLIEKAGPPQRFTEREIAALDARGDALLAQPDPLPPSATQAELGRARDLRARAAEAREAELDAPDDRAAALRARAERLRTEGSDPVCRRAADTDADPALPLCPAGDS